MSNFPPRVWVYPDRPVAAWLVGEHPKPSSCHKEYLSIEEHQSLLAKKEELIIFYRTKIIDADKEIARLREALEGVGAPKRIIYGDNEALEAK